jgi:hypothetical protein
VASVQKHFGVLKNGDSPAVVEKFRVELNQKLVASVQKHFGVLENGLRLKSAATGMSDQL